MKLLPSDAGDRRYFFSPLGADAPLFNAAEAEDTITHIATRANVPQPITRRELHDALEAYYPASVAVSCGGVALPVTTVAASDLSDLPGGAWAYADSDTVLIDPVLGRLVLPASLVVDGHAVPMSDPFVSFHYGFPADLGGGAVRPRYHLLPGRERPRRPDARAPGVGPGWHRCGADRAGRHARRGGDRERPPRRRTDASRRRTGRVIELRAADGVRPTLVLGQDLVIDGGKNAEVILNGFLVIGGAVSVVASSGLRRLRLVHCTLVPGLTLATDGTPQSPDAPSVVVDAPGVTLEIDHCIVGGLRIHEDAVVRIGDGIVDATDQTRVAFAAPDGTSAGGELSIVAGTVIGKVHARILRLVSNSILAARLGVGDPWPFPVHAERRQEGCVRFSYVPPGSRTPRRHACQPASAADATRVQPMFTASRYGRSGLLPARAAWRAGAAYGQRRRFGDGRVPRSLCAAARDQRDGPARGVSPLRTRGGDPLRELRRAHHEGRLRPRDVRRAQALRRPPDASRAAWRRRRTGTSRARSSGGASASRRATSSDRAEDRKAIAASPSRSAMT